jgi:hypothetical protein
MDFPDLPGAKLYYDLRKPFLILQNLKKTEGNGAPGGSLTPLGVRLTEGAPRALASQHYQIFRGWEV